MSEWKFHTEAEACALLSVNRPGPGFGRALFPWRSRTRAWPTCSAQGRTVTISGFVGHRVYTASALFCPSSLVTRRGLLLGAHAGEQVSGTWLNFPDWASQASQAAFTERLCCCCWGGPRREWPSAPPPAGPRGSAVAALPTHLLKPLPGVRAPGRHLDGWAALLGFTLCV